MFGFLSSVSEVVFKIAKGLFFGALISVTIIGFVGLLSQLTFHSVVGEFFALVSLCLPFNAGAVFGTIALNIAAIVGFLVANKTFNLFHKSWT